MDKQIVQMLECILKNLCEFSVDAISPISGRRNQRYQNLYREMGDLRQHLVNWKKEQNDRIVSSYANVAIGLHTPAYIEDRLYPILEKEKDIEDSLLETVIAQERTIRQLEKRLEIFREIGKEEFVETLTKMKEFLKKK